MANDKDSPQKGYKFFCERAQDGKAFTLDELEKETGWSRASIDTYRSKQWKELLEKAAVAGTFSVRREFLRLSEKEFLDHISQKRPLFAHYRRIGHPHYVMFEFLLPLTRESELRVALDELFYADTVGQRLREIGIPKLDDIVPRKDKESADAYYTRMTVFATERFGGYSISHVSGRYKAAALMSRQAALTHVVGGGRYLIDETTAVVRFVIPCRTGEYSFSDTLEESFSWTDLLEDKPHEALSKEVDEIRKLFFLLFVESVVRTIKGEDEIWLLESGAHHRLYRWERVAS